MAIHYFEIEGSKSGLKYKRKLNEYLNHIITSNIKVKKININFVFCDDDYLLEKNLQYLNHDTLTDIITFDLSEQEDVLSAEIYISLQRVHDNATIFQTTFHKELHRVIFHGILHLCGFKDKTSEEKKLMRLKEDECIKEYYEPIYESR